MQTGIARTADGLLLPPQAFGPMFQAFVEVALSPFKRSPIVVVIMHYKVPPGQAGTVSAHSGAHARRPHTMGRLQIPFLTGPSCVASPRGAGAPSTRAATVTRG